MGDYLWDNDSTTRVFKDQQHLKLLLYNFKFSYSLLPYTAQFFWGGFVRVRGSSWFLTWSISTVQGWKHTQLYCDFTTANLCFTLSAGSVALTEPPLNPTFWAQINASSLWGLFLVVPTAGLWHLYSMYSRHSHFLAGATGTDVLSLHWGRHVHHTA